MNQVSYQPASQALCDYIDRVCPLNAHMHVVMRGVWVSGNVPADGVLYKSATTTRWIVVRAWSCHGRTYWTRENFEHDNGIRCTLDILTKVEFLQAIK